MYNCKMAGEEYLKTHLKDWDSYESIGWNPEVQDYTIADPRGGEYPNQAAWMLLQKGLITKNVCKELGYTIAHKYRAKNSFGGYNIVQCVFFFDKNCNVIDYSSSEGE